MAVPWMKPISIALRLLVGLALISVALLIFTTLVRTRPAPAPSDRADEADPIQVIPASYADVRRSWQGYGTAAPIDTSDVPAEVAAMVVDTPRDLDAGVRVETGDVLARLDASDFIRRRNTIEPKIAEMDARLKQLDVEEASWKARLEILEESIEIERRDIERYADARERNAALARELDQARDRLTAKLREREQHLEAINGVPPRRAQLEAQRAGLVADLSIVEKDIERTHIAAPITGVLQTYDAEVGERVNIGERVARIVNLDRIEVPIRLSASARYDVAIGDTVTLRSTGADRRTWEGRIARISPADDEQTRTMTMYVELEQDSTQPGALSPGKFLEATVQGRTTERRMVLPRRAVQGDRVFLVEDNVVTSRPVQTAFHVEGTFPEIGPPDTDWIVLAEPLDEGVLVVLNASTAARAGSEVRPVKYGAARNDASLETAQRPVGDGSESTP